MGYAAVPASTGTLCKYAAMLARTHKFSSIKQYLNVVGILHRQWDLANPLQDNFHLGCTLRGIHRQLGSKVSRKAPISPELLLDVLGSLNMSNPTECNIWAAALTMFFGMLRKSNVLSSSPNTFDPSRHLRRKDIQFHQNGMTITIRWSKTIQFKDRLHIIPLPRTPSSLLCPTLATFHAFSLTNAAHPEGPAFVAMHSNNITPLTVSDFMHTINKVLLNKGYDVSAFGTHSFRRGGATLAFHSGVPVETIKHIGDWKSLAYTKYIVPTDESLQKATQAMVSNIRL